MKNHLQQQALTALYLLLVAGPAALAQRAETGGDFFATDTAGLVRRSDIVLQRQNAKPEEAMPLGNGQLGAAVWTADGLTVQLNRGDSFPNRLSSGQLVVPGLARLTGAKDFSARLDMYDGEFRASGGGMTLTAFLDKTSDTLELDVTGADPAALQSAELKLWEPRHPQVHVDARAGVLAETWQDTGQDGATGATFGTLAAITADARELQISQSSPLSVNVAFLPSPNGSYRLLVAAPHWSGGDAQARATAVLGAALALRPSDHQGAWHDFWHHVALMKLSSLDGAAEYFEALRIVDLYTAAAESLGRFPGSQAGIGDLFSSIRDSHNWGPPDYWHWNLRMQVAANLGAGVPELNNSYFRLYEENLPELLQWTKTHMGGHEGICIPETMRFSGQGYENETWLHGPAPINCGLDSPPYYNARTLSTGAEVSLWIWEQYRLTGNLAFLKANYGVMRESARFLLSYATRDKAGVLHTFPANAHENQWDVQDPIPDIAAMRALFPVVARAADLLGTDVALAATLRSGAEHLPALPEVSAAEPHRLLAPGTTVEDAIFAESYNPEATIHNVENDGLEPVWPYGLVGDEGPLHTVAVNTFMNRRNKWEADWSFDPMQAARLGLADQVETSLRGLTERYQAYPSGMAKFEGPEFYVEQIGVLTSALQESLVQDYDGLLRLAPAWPADWSGEAEVAIPDGGRVRLQLQSGRLQRAAVQAGRADHLRLRNPWPGEAVNVFDPAIPRKPALTSSARILEIPTLAQHVYVLQRAAQGGNLSTAAPMQGEPAAAPKRLGERTLGLFPGRP